MPHILVALAGTAAHPKKDELADSHARPDFGAAKSKKAVQLKS
jgi:hypothetical protein